MQSEARHYCPSCGALSLTRVTSKKFLCSECAFTVFNNVATGVAAIIEYQDNIILTCRAKDPAKGKLDLPGGFVDAGESLEGALQREVMEELGIPIYDLAYLCSFPNTYPYKGLVYSVVDSIFVCKTDQLPSTCQTSEIEHFILVDPLTVNSAELAFESLAQAFALYQQRLRQSGRHAS